MKSLIQVEELKGVDVSMAQSIRDTFNPMADMLERMEEQYNNVIEESKKEITAEVTKKAKRTRLDIAKVRIATDKARKDQKSQYLLAGRAIDGVANILKLAVSKKEEKLKDIENHFENLKKERLTKLQNERVLLLSQYINDAEERKLSDMEKEVWSAYLNTKKQEHEDKIKAEKQAEIDRLEQEKRIKAEQEELRQNELRKIEADKQARIEAEKKTKELELLKSDSEKIKDLKDDLLKITEKYSFQSKLNQEIYLNISNWIFKITNEIDNAKPTIRR